jgi:hypothetical protein
MESVPNDLWLKPHKSVSSSAAQAARLPRAEAQGCEEVFPRHLYRLAPEASRQYARIWQHMERCSTLLLTRAAY